MNILSIPSIPVYKPVERRYIRSLHLNEEKVGTPETRGISFATLIYKCGTKDYNM